MKVSGSKTLTFAREKECKSGLTALCTKDGFKILKPTGLEDLFMPTVMYTTDAGSMTKLTDKVSTVIWTEQSTRVIGRKINKVHSTISIDPRPLEIKPLGIKVLDERSGHTNLINFNKKIIWSPSKLNKWIECPRKGLSLIHI